MGQKITEVRLGQDVGSRAGVRVISFNQPDATIPGNTHIFNADRDYYISRIDAVWQTNGGASAACMPVVLVNDYLTSIAASGQSLLSAAIDMSSGTGVAKRLNSTAAAPAGMTVTALSFTATDSLRKLLVATQPLLALKFTGTLTALVGFNVNVWLVPLSDSQYNYSSW